MAKGQITKYVEFANTHRGEVLGTAEIVQGIADIMQVSKREITIMPSDFCYPTANLGICLFMKKSRGVYECLGENATVAPVTGSGQSLVQSATVAQKISVTAVATPQRVLYPIKDLYNGNEYLLWDTAMVSQLVGYMQSMALYLMSFPHVSLLRKIYCSLPVFKEESICSCRVTFASAEEMKQYIRSTDEYLKTIRKKGGLLPRVEVELQKNINVGLDSNLADAIFGELNKLKGICAKSPDRITHNETRHVCANIKAEIIPALRKKMAATREKTVAEALCRLIDKLLLLADFCTLIAQHGNPLGVYLVDTKPLPTIILCLENIKNAANSQGIAPSALAESVLAHEYTHHVHISLTKPKQLSLNPSYKISAVQETVAQTVQYLFAVAVDTANANGTPLTAWVQSHSSSGAFPGWGYAGERIVRAVAGYPEVLDIERGLLNSVASTSLKEMKKAYDIISACEDIYIDNIFTSGKPMNVAQSIDFVVGFYTFYGKAFQTQRRSDIFEYCLSQGWRDAMIYERKNVNSIVMANKDSIIDSLRNEIVNNLSVWSRDFDAWHKAFCAQTMYNMRVGLWQKFINMTTKWLFCAHAGYGMLQGFDFDVCHCPIDSHIAAIARRKITAQHAVAVQDMTLLASVAQSGKKNWNNIDYDEYLRIQQIITMLAKQCNQSTLQFDFAYWE